MASARAPGPEMPAGRGVSTVRERPAGAAAAEVAPGEVHEQQPQETKPARLSRKGVSNVIGGCCRRDPASPAASSPEQRTRGSA